MLVADAYLGHREDPDVAERLADADPARVVLSDVDRRRSRVRTETEDGRDLGVVVGRELADGDVLETESGDLVVVELAAVEALVLDFEDADVSATAALELGHAAGNRHWDLAVRDGEALFPMADSRERMEAAVADSLPDDVAVRTERVPPTTFDDGGSPGGHEHSHGDGHSHSHDSHSHDHSHGDHSHAHDHGIRTIDGGDDA
ncbi:urease accessory protein UreE [Halomicrobium salinisoli]|uniref:urease accessory protein UreE n=1 Tax=Halomicrobium salinisoli TaxID=2878391 RepID=UPI001CEFD488|nr:urease accessory protein UreE [Halomicrobium salinisoli]